MERGGQADEEQDVIGQVSGNGSGGSLDLRCALHGSTAILEPLMWTAKEREGDASSFGLSN